MAIANRAVLETLNQSFNTILNNALNEADVPNLDPLRMVIDSNTAIEGYAWLGNFPRIRKWVGERRVSDFEAKSHTIPNETFEGTLTVKREDIEDDRTGLYRPQIEMLGQDLPKRKHRDMVELIKAAFTGVTYAGDNEEERAVTTYDGVGFFATNHPRSDGTTQSNLTNLGYDPRAYATGTAANKETLIGDVRDAIKAMKRITDDQNQDLLDVRPTTLVYGTDMDVVVDFLFRTEEYENGNGNMVRNPLFGAFDEEDMIELPRLEASEGEVGQSLLMFDTSLPIRPFIWQDRQAPRYGIRNNPNDSDRVFMTNKFYYGLDARWGYGFGLWQLGYAVSP